MNQKIPATIKEQVQKLRDRGCVIMTKSWLNRP